MKTSLDQSLFFAALLGVLFLRYRSAKNRNTSNAPWLISPANCYKVFLKCIERVKGAVVVSKKRAKTSKKLRLDHFFSVTHNNARQ
jgi:hypothetical protein